MADAELAHLAHLRADLEAAMLPDELDRYRANLARLEQLDEVVGPGMAASVLVASIDAFIAGDGRRFVDVLEGALDVIERS